MPLLITVVCHSYGYREQNSEEQPFSTMNYGKNKHRSRLTDDSLQFWVKMRSLCTAPICRRCAHRFISRSPSVPRQTPTMFARTHFEPVRYGPLFTHGWCTQTAGCSFSTHSPTHTQKTAERAQTTPERRDCRCRSGGSTSPAAALQTTPRHTYQTRKINIYALLHSLFVFCYFYTVFWMMNNGLQPILCIIIQTLVVRFR